MSTRGARPCLFEELAEQALGGLRVAPALDEDIENEAILVDGTPKPMLLPGDADDDLVKVPLVATARRSPTDAVGEFPAEFQAPLPDRLMRHRYACQPTRGTDPLATLRIDPRVCGACPGSPWEGPARSAAPLRGKRSGAREGPVDPPGQASVMPLSPNPARSNSL